jgi:enoyl-CoA hydratase/carnithine racemase
MLEELSEVLDSAEAGRADKLIFTGTAGVFASGADLREIADLTSEPLLRRSAGPCIGM